LVKKKELMKIRQKAREKGLTLIPLRLYFRGKWAKLEIGLCRGRTHGDKRNVLKDRQAKRDIRRATKGF
jgi:SsrA-binding protein